MKFKSLVQIFLFTLYVKLNTKLILAMNNDELYGRERMSNTLFETPLERLTKTYIKYVWTIKGNELSKEEIESGLLILLYILNELSVIRERNKENPPEYWYSRMGK